MDFASRLKTLRKRADLSQEALAAKAGRSGQSWIGNFETGRQTPRLEDVIPLAAALGVHPGEFFADLPSQPTGLDLERLGVALTAMEKALDDRVIQGHLGTLAEALLFAYLRSVKLNDPADPHQRELFDDVVREHLRGWDGRGGTVEPGQIQDRPVAAKAARAGGRKG